MKDNILFTELGGCMEEIYIIEFPSNLGLKEPAPGKEPGVKNLPGWLKQFGLYDMLKAGYCIRLAAPGYNGERDAATGLLNAAALAEYAVEQAAILSPLLKENKFPFILGGDCSILLGAALAMKQQGNYALFYLDGHTDFMDVALSETGGVGGMAASVVAGKGHPQLTNIGGLAPYIEEENTWCVGNREYDDAYEDEIRNSNATYVSLAKLRETGMATCVQQFLKQVTTKKLDGFWFHFDVDALNNDIMPCVDSPAPDGLTWEEFSELAHYLFGSHLLKGLEITILDPDLDKDGKYTAPFVHKLVQCFMTARYKSPGIST